MDRIGLLVQLIGDKQALGSLKNIYSITKQLQHTNIDLRVEKNKLARDIDYCIKSIRYLQRYKVRPNVSTENVEKADKRIRELYENLLKLQSQARNMQIDINMNTQALSILREMQREAISLRDVLSGAGTWFSAIGSGLQSIGGIFNTDILSYITQTLTQMGTSAVMNNLGKAATRYDTLRTYPMYLEAIGVSADKAEASLNAVDQAIQGLPIGLNDAALDVRRTTMLMDGDIDTATKFVQGFDQALFAGGAPQQMRNYSYIEMQRLLASGELAQKRQWMSLINGLGVSTQFLKDAMGYTDMTTKEFEDMVYDPDRGVTGEEVIQGFAKLADDPKLKEFIEIYKSTIESGLSNLQYAVQRGIANVYKAADETMQETTGMSISEYLYSGRNFIDRAFGGIAEWVRDNPDTIQGIIKQVEGLAHRAEQFDWGRLASSIISSLESIVNIATWVYDHVPEPIIQKFLTFSMVWASPLGKGFSALGNLLTTLAYLPFPKFGLLAKGMSGMGRLMTSVKGIGKGFLGASAFIGIIAEIGAVVWEFTKVAETISNADLTGFDKNIGPLINFFANAGGLATILTGVFSFISSVPGGFLVAGAGEILSAGLVAIVGEIGLVIKEFVGVANQIATSVMPSDTQLKRVGDVFKSFGEIFTTDLFLNVPSAWKIDRLTDAINLINELSAVTDGLDAIADANINTSKVSANMTAMIQVFSDLNLMMSQDFWASDAFTSKQYLKIVTNLTDMITEISNAFTTMNDLNTMLDESGIMDRGRGGGSAYENVVNAMEMLASDMQEIASAVSVNSDILGSKREEIVDGIRNEIIQDYTAIVGSITDLATEITNSKEVLSEATQGGTLAIVTGQMGVVLDRIKDMLIDVNDKVLLINQAAEAKDWGYIAQKIDSYKSVITSIIGIVGELKDGADDLAWTHTASFVDGKLDQSSVIAVVGNLRRFIQTLMQMAPEFDSLNGLNVTNVSANAAALSESIGKLTETAQTLSEMSDMLATINTEGGAVYNLKKMLTELTETLSGNDATFSAANFTAMATAISTLQTSLQGIVDIDWGGTTGNVKDLVEQLKDMGDKAKDGAENINELRNKMVVLSGVAQGIPSRFTEFIGSLNRIKNSSYEALTNVNSLISALNAISDKTITITVNTPGLDNAVMGLRSLNALASAASGVVNVLDRVRNAVYRHTGGEVSYLAKGGSPFQPKGSDTVPAMLTPGEWVINRSAVRAFGTDFMKKVNRMDIPGAMDALMSRSKWIPNGNISYTTNNYNNQSVTQNFKGNRDTKSSYRLANRYLGAL